MHYYNFMYAYLKMSDKEKKVELDVLGINKLRCELINYYTKGFAAVP